ncbi:MAG TPA: DUF4932 domain-containing protein [Chitinophagaceae bacterium]|jgi:hypothetical protein|nr:DUF4932 domain-containing protein [Chitinophagaceae bacterium]
MRCLFFLLCCLAAAAVARAQHVEETYPQTLWCPNDTFYLTFKGDDRRLPYRVSREDQSSPGTDGAPGEYTTVYYGNDSLRLNYHNRIPYAHIIYLNFASPKGKTTLRFHYNDVACYFPAAYRQQHKGGIQFDIPEVYELANIIWTLSPRGRRAADLNKEGPYFEEVQAYFQPYLDHPVFKALDFPDSLYAAKYYSFRENSFAFNFRTPSGSPGTELLFNGPYYFVYGDGLADSSLFGKLKPLVEDFAGKSGFRQFYRQHAAYYAKELRRQKELLPVRSMWTWLEQQFPRTRYQSYRIVFSPLIGGSHSTQRYYTYDSTEWFGENVMFVCGPARYDRMPGLTEKQKEGLMSGVVFTEIDHNYVNPATNKYARQVDSIFSQKGIWTKPGPASDFYNNAVSVFNEYLTHAAFCLYVLDTYDPSTAEYVIRHREELMVERRNFTRFREFNRELIRLRKAHPERTVAELYPALLHWCSGQR